MKTGKVVIGMIAGGLIGATAAVMTVPGYRSMVVRKGRKMFKMAKQFFPMG
jgi:gas vesicle protein